MPLLKNLVLKIFYRGNNTNILIILLYLLSVLADTNYQNQQSW
jgi:hypothetical protein